MDLDNTDSEPIADLEQSLIDERALRSEAQRRVRELEDRASLWRTRAEQRAERIKKLEVDQQRSAPVRWLTSLRGNGPSMAPTAPPRAAQPGSPPRVATPAIPGTSIVHNASGVLGAVLREGNAGALDARPWDSVDLVVVDPSTLPTDDLTRFRAWVERSPRPSTVVVTDDPDAWRAADTTVGAGGFQVPDPIGEGVRGGTPSIELLGATDDDELLVRDNTGNPMGLLIDPANGGYRSAPRAAVDLAASGVPIGTSVEEVLSEGQGARARRWAWKQRDPAVVLDRILDSVGVHHRDPRPTVAGLLVSNRPDRILGAIDGFLGQHYDRKELVVGCHGFDSADVVAHIDGLDTPEDIQVLSFPMAWSLGRCLNEAALATSTSLLAKIDDDDYYGPHYLLDAVLARRYSGAEVVGKAAQFTYVESADTTVLRRAATEEMLVDGVLTGATLVFDRAIWDAVRFPDRPRMVDVHLISGARAAGANVYANGRWEFVYRRSVAGHTWMVDDDEFLRGSVHAWNGWDPDGCILTELT